MNVEIWTVIGGIATAIVSFFVARINIKNDRQQFYENKITSLLENQSSEIRELKSEIERLTMENHKLNNQVMELTIKLELREKQYDEQKHS